MITSITAAVRRQSDIALGNVLGSSIYNILGIGGLTALIAPTVVPREIVRFDNIVMIACLRGAPALRLDRPADRPKGRGCARDRLSRLSVGRMAVELALELRAVGRFFQLTADVVRCL